MIGGFCWSIHRVASNKYYSSSKNSSVEKTNFVSVGVPIVNSDLLLRIVNPFLVFFLFLLFISQVHFYFHQVPKPNFFDFKDTLVNFRSFGKDKTKKSKRVFLQRMKDWGVVSSLLRTLS